MPPESHFTIKKVPPGPMAAENIGQYLVAMHGPVGRLLTLAEEHARRDPDIIPVNSRYRLPWP